MNIPLVDDFGEDDDDDLEIIDLLQHGLPRQVYQRHNYFEELDDAGFRRRFRLSGHTAIAVLGLIEKELEYPYDSNNSVSPMNQLLTCLRFFSTGGYLQSIADFAGMHLSTVSRIIVRVSEAIARKYNQCIYLPRNRDNVRKSQQEFFNIASFPRIVGAIDCTHIRIQSPGGDDAEIFRNRKSYFSINAQMICNAKLKIMNVVARWPGSTHDATIFANSTVCHNFENNLYPNCILLGDSGYPLKTYIFTSLLNPITHAEQLYNESHIRSRNTIERCFGVLKRRFPVLAYGCRLKIETVLTIIVATSILHNIAIDNGEEQPAPISEELDEHALQILIDQGQIPAVIRQENDGVAAGNIMRQQFIDEYFFNL